MTTRLKELIDQGIVRPVGRNRRGYEIFERRTGERVVCIPDGAFLMGSDDAEARRIEEAVPWYKATVAECPQWSAWMCAYLIDEYEVTCERFAGFLSASRCVPERDPQLRGTIAALSSEGAVLAYDAVDYVERRGIPGSSHAVGVHWTDQGWEPLAGSEHCPMVLVTWFGAREYANWTGFGLPTEAQWEKAARGTDGHRFPWGDKYEPQYANVAEYWLGKTIGNQETWDKDFFQRGRGQAWLRSRPLPIGSNDAGASPYGCYEMVGNVAEWCGNWYSEDAYARYASSGVDFGPLVAESRFRCMRGAGRYGYEAIARCACRRRREPASVSENLGFRCALTLETPIMR